MAGRWLKRLTGLLIAAAIAAGVVWFGWPRPVGVDLATVTTGAMDVTVDEEAKTRVRHIYTVSAPLAGKVLRVPYHVGDQVRADETVVAVMQPTVPSFHDVRSHEELRGAAAAAEAAVKFAEAEVRRIEAALEFSRSELLRAQALARTNTIAARSLEKAKFDVETNEAALASTKAQLEARRSERASAAARLMDGTTPTAQPPATCCVQIGAPVTGRVLKIIQESEAVVASGAPLIEIGDPRDLELVAELLSPEAVRVKAGSRVRIDGWGGPVLQGRVTRVEPAGFTKVSALGIEEQRVKTIIDLVDPPEAWSALGHDFRVVVHITTWRSESALVVPVGALFRRGDEWAVFVLRDGRARVTPVRIDHRTSRVAEVVAGLSEGDRVVLHPSDRVRDGIAVTDRGASNP